jgi:hypothetical protein
MAEDLISQLVDPSAQKQLDDIALELTAILGQMVQINKMGIDFAGKASGASNLKDLTKEMLNLEAAAAKVEQQQSKAALSALKLQQAQEKIATAANAEANALAKEVDAYTALSKQYNEAARTAQNLAASNQGGTQAFRDAAKEAKSLNDRLKEIDASVGRHTRNVGNYASGWNAVQNSTNQIVRELPSLSNGFNQFFLAISNNIGPMQDALIGARKKNEELAASGKASVAVWQQVAGALLSWNTALTLGITILAAYGKDIIEFVFQTKKAAEATDQFADSVQHLNDGLSESQSIVDRTTRIRVAQADALGKSESEVFDIQKKGLQDQIKAQDQAVKDQLDNIGYLQDAQTKLRGGIKLTGLTEESITKDLADAQKNLGKLMEDRANAQAQLEINNFNKIAAARKAAEREAAKKPQKETGPIYLSPTDEDIKALDNWNKELEMLENLAKNITDTKLDQFAKELTNASSDTAAADLNLTLLNNKKKKKDTEDTAQHEKDLWQEVYAEEEQLAKDATQTFFDLQNQRLQRQINDQETQKRLITERLALELNAIDLSMESEQMKNKQKADLNAQALAEEQSADAKIRALKRKQAINDRMAAIAAVIENTAIAVSKVWGETGLAGAILQALPIAMGALQIVNIMSAPLPSYFKGTKSSGEGPAIVGELGSEMMIGSDGRIGFTPDHATIQYLKAGTQIIPADQTLEIAKAFAANDGYDSRMINDTRLLEATVEGNKALLESNRELIRTLRNKQFKSQDINFDLYVRSKTGR